MITHFEFYEDIDELPIWKKQEASNYALMANFCEPSIEGINGRLSQFDSHFGRLYGFIESNDIDKAKEAISELYKSRVNLSIAFNENMSKTHYDTLIGACYVSHIKGVKVSEKKDSSELKRIAEMLSDSPSKELSSKIQDIKKKLTLN